MQYYVIIIGHFLSRYWIKVLKFDDYIASRYPMPITFSPSKVQAKMYIVKTRELYQMIENICN